MKKNALPQGIDPFGSIILLHGQALVAPMLIKMCDARRCGFLPLPSKLNDDTGARAWLPSLQPLSSSLIRGHLTAYPPTPWQNRLLEFIHQWCQAGHQPSLIHRQRLLWVEGEFCCGWLYMSVSGMGLECCAWWHAFKSCPGAPPAGREA